MYGETEAVHTEFWWTALIEKDLGVEGRVILKCIFKKYHGDTWT
jgi:hypothetical protein